MTLCPIALAVSCKKCPAFAVCPLKTTLGNHKKEKETPPLDEIQGDVNRERRP